MSDKYDVLPLPTHLGSIIDKNNNRLKPFVAIYFPAELLEKMKWEQRTRLTLSIEKDCLKICKRDAGDETDLLFDLNELVYVPVEDEV